MELSILLWVLAALLVLAGFAGLFLPMLPGAVLLFAGLAVAAWADDFVYVGWGTLTALGVLALLTYPADLFASAFGAKRYGASPRAVTGAVVGAGVGIFFGLPGILLGPFVGAVVGEFSTQRHLGKAGRAGFGATVGIVLGTAAKLAIAFTMLGIFAIARFAGGN
ncbi:membrane protein [Sulfuricaulis limicola]|uniref:Membrane protein n=1 Tax=Sulfuricaulis limicola TaxID=1620215 RepID=A0A1B4XJI3_9GAMM|nr:DUF456 domain-containing protein [Sulfuricaulis limicola]BAV34969.1 membrane protein [Sulfuricaulis limicola]